MLGGTEVSLNNSSSLDLSLQPKVNPAGSLGSSSLHGPMSETMGTLSSIEPSCFYMFAHCLANSSGCERDILEGAMV